MKKESVLFLVLFCGFVFWQFYISRFQYGESVLIGKPAPHFEAQDVRTQAILKSQDLFGKKAVFINFWATWCETCHLEKSSLSQLYKSIDHNQVAFVSFMEDAEAQNPIDAQMLLNRYEKKFPIEYPVYLDSQQIVADLYGTFQIPESYVIDASGQVIYRHEGAILAKDLPLILEKLSKN